MKIISKKTCLSALVAAGILTLGLSSAQAKNYSANIYVAGMGGHFANAAVTIDPNAPTPIYLKSLSKIDISGSD